MKILTFTFAILVSIVCVVARAEALVPTYYVDSISGSDSNPGTSESEPWKTLHRVQRASLAAGDFVAFKSGSVWRGRHFAPQSGTPGNPIIYGAYGTGDAPKITRSKLIPNNQWVKASGDEYYYAAGIPRKDVLLIKNSDRLVGKRITAHRTVPSPPKKGSLKKGEWYHDRKQDRIYYRDFGNGRPTDIEFSVGWGSSLHISGGRNITIQDIEFYGSSANIARVGNSSNITIRNCKIHAGIRGLQVLNSRDVLIDGNEVYDIDWKGIGALNGSSYITISNNHVHAIGKLSTDDSDWEGILAGGGLDHFKRPHHITIIDNHVEDIGQDAYAERNGGNGMNSVGIVADAVSDVLIARNRVHNTWRKGITVFGSSAETWNITIHSNLIYDIGHMSKLNWQTFGLHIGSRGFATHDVDIYNNTVADSNFSPIGTTGAAFNIGVNSKSTDSHIYNVNFFNNILHVNEGRLINAWVGTGTKGLQGFYSDNNLFYKVSGNAIKWSGIGSYAYNKIIGSDTGFWNNDSGWDGNSISGVPHFINKANDNYHLDEKSPAINAGHTSDRTSDFDGNPVVDVPDIGAFERSKPDADGLSL